MFLWYPDGRSDEESSKINEDGSGPSHLQPQQVQRKRSSSSEAGTPITPKCDDRIFFGSNFNLESVPQMIGLPKPVLDGMNKH